jgi:hypothetical protein
MTRRCHLTAPLGYSDADVCLCAKELSPFHRFHCIHMRICLGQCNEVSRAAALGTNNGKQQTENKGCIASLASAVVSTSLQNKTTSPLIHED